MTPTCIRIAHDALCRNKPPYLNHYKRGKFVERYGAYFSRGDLPGPGFNFASCVDPCGPLDEIVAFGNDYYAGTEGGWGVLVEGGAGHPIEVEMLARGWSVAEDEPAYVIEKLVAPPTTVGGKLNIHPITTTAAFDAFRRVCMAAFGAPPELSEAVMPSLAYATDPDMYWVIGEVAGVPVAAGGTVDVGRTAIVGGLATLEEHRGRGYGAAVTNYLLARAADAGFAHACLRSGPKSVPLYERVGFRYACQHRTYGVPATSPTAPASNPAGPS